MGWLLLDSNQHTCFTGAAITDRHEPAPTPPFLPTLANFLRTKIWLISGGHDKIARSQEYLGAENPLSSDQGILDGAGSSAGAICVNIGSYSGRPFTGSAPAASISTSAHLRS
jgi:hypothetical protein